MTHNPQTADDARLDKEYALGYAQAWREWSACVAEGRSIGGGKINVISDDDLDTLDRSRRIVFKNRGLNV